jgi:hypothetical protein
MTRSEPEPLVDHRRLADVRPADERQADDVLLRRLVVLGQELDEPVEQVPRPEPLRGRDRDGIAEAEPVELQRARHVAHRVDLVGGHDRRQARAAQEVGHLLVPGRRPARASTTSSATWASASAAWACSRMEPEMGSASWKSMPPVSMSVKRRPFHSHGISLRSRVIPGRSWTTASRRWVSRLTREDLPTLG